jgi:hypothetical protein
VPVEGVGLTTWLLRHRRAKRRQEAATHGAAAAALCAVAVETTVDETGVDARSSVLASAISKAVESPASRQEQSRGRRARRCRSGRPAAATRRSPQTPASPGSRRDLVVRRHACGSSIPAVRAAPRIASDRAGKQERRPHCCEPQSRPCHRRETLLRLGTGHHAEGVLRHGCYRDGAKPNISHAWWLTHSGYSSVMAS